MKQTTKKKSEKRVGIFGGTFNPVHLGHLRGAEEIRECFRLDQIVFIPSSHPPHKAGSKVIEGKYRLEMLKLAASGNPFFSTSALELSRSGKSYTIDTLRILREQFKASPFFILGRDAFEEIETWREFQNLFTMAHFIVMGQPGSLSDTASLIPKTLAPAFRYDPKQTAWIHRSGHRLYFKEISFLDISSTRIRNLIGKGQSTRYLIPEKVGIYIQKHRLYGQKPS